MALQTPFRARSTKSGADRQTLEVVRLLTPDPRLCAHYISESASIVAIFNSPSLHEKNTGNAKNLHQTHRFMAPKDSDFTE